MAQSQVVDGVVAPAARAIFERLRRALNWGAWRGRSQHDLAAALAASESRYRHLVENAPDIVYRTDAHGNFTFVNPIAEAILGRTQAELIGHHYLEFIHPLDREPLRRQYGLQWARGTPTTYAEFRVSSPRDEQVWIGQNVQLLFENGYRMGFQAVARDITSRKRVEESLARVRKQNESILNSAAEGILGVDREGCLVMANPTAAQLTGYTVGEMLGQHAHSLLHHTHVDGTGHPAEECAILNAIDAGSPLTREADLFWRRDGSSFPIEYTIVPTRDDGSITGAVLTFHDISERVRIERMKDEVISILSHELRTPLTSIRGSLGLVAGGLLESDSKRANRMIELAVANTDRLIRLANDIIDVQRLSTDNMPLYKQQVEVRALVARAVASLGNRADAAHVHIEEDVPATDVSADPDRLAQALANLVENAITFSPADSRIEVHVDRRHDELLFGVRDYGRGIPKNRMHALFNVLEQLDASDSRPQGGLGLGLTITRRIVELHGGRIWVDSTVGKGSTFWFTIPCNAAA